jgi:hypothetical protein
MRWSPLAQRIYGEGDQKARDRGIAEGAGRADAGAEV